jgi:hypothetical protein
MDQRLSHRSKSRDEWRVGHRPPQKRHFLGAGGSDCFWYQMCEHCWFLRVVQVGRGRLKHEDLKRCDAACNASVIDAMVQWLSQFFLCICALVDLGTYQGLKYFC